MKPLTSKEARDALREFCYGMTGGQEFDNYEEALLEELNALGFTPEQQALLATSSNPMLRLLVLRSK